MTPNWIKRHPHTASLIFWLTLCAWGLTLSVLVGQ